MLRTLFAFLTLAAGPALLAQGTPAPAPKLAGVTAHVYKQTPTRPLLLYSLKPPATFAGPRPAIVFFFGGGWTGGSTDQFDDQAEYFAARGFVTLLADYRIKQRDQSTPFESVEDARSALRWVRSHAAELHIDARRIVASGGSAGGHVAGATAILAKVNDPADDLTVSPVPAALVLFNPVLDTTEKGYGAKAIGPRAEELSLTSHLKPGLPPTIIFHGTADHTVPFQNPVDFTRLAKANGDDCELVPFEGVGHGFFNSPGFRKTSSPETYRQILQRVDAFFQHHGFAAAATRTAIPRQE